MSDPCMIIKFSDFKFKIEDANEPSGYFDCHGNMEVSYDGEILGIDTWEAPVGTEITSQTPCQSLTLVGSDQANLLIGAILALLEAYNQPSYFNDENIQVEYGQIIQEAKNSKSKEAATELLD